MKKILIATVLMAGVTAVAFASISHNKKKTCTQKKVEKKNKHCTRTCMFS